MGTRYKLRHVARTAHTPCHYVILDTWKEQGWDSVMAHCDCLTDATLIVSLLNREEDRYGAAYAWLPAS